MKESRTAFTSLITHVIVWAVIFLLPLLTASVIGSLHINAPDYLRYAVFTTGHLALFYLNYTSLVDRFLIGKFRIWRFVLCNLLVFLVIDVLTRVFFGLTDDGFSPNLISVLWPAPFRVGIVLIPVVSKILVVLIAVSIKSTGKARQEEQRREALERERTEAELKYLKDKLNPHFLFNALNNIYALTSIDSGKAQTAIDSLSKLLRYVLYENDSDLVPLEDELEFTRCYIDLMALRIDPSKTALTVDFGNVPSRKCRVAPLMVMTLIENVFKHGVSSREKSFIDIKLSFDEERMYCLVSNSLFPKDCSDKSGSGVGLNNLRRRLSILYGPEASFENISADGVYSAQLQIPLRHE